MTTLAGSALPGAFVISLDFELDWGLYHHGPPSLERQASLAATRRVVPEMLSLFDERAVAATWATVGFLFAGRRDELESFSPACRPGYLRAELDPYRTQVGIDEGADPIHLGRSLVDEIAATPGQEVASHTFSHYLCLETGQDVASFRADLEAARRIAGARGISLRSLVFPSNQVNRDYLPVLKEQGFIAYRGAQRGRLNRPSPKGRQHLARRLARAADCYVRVEGHGLSSWDGLIDRSGLCNVAASRFLRPYADNMSLIEPLRLKRVVGALRQAARTGRIFHLWWHPHNFGHNSDKNLDCLRRILDAFEALRHSESMRSMTMAEVAEVAEKALSSRS